jgi:hypothetical protein
MSSYQRVVNAANKISASRVETTKVKTRWGGTARQDTKGAAELQLMLKTMPIAVVHAVKAGVLRAALEGFEAAMNRVPLDTGELARSGQLRVNNELYAEGEYYGGDATTVRVIGDKAEQDLAVDPTDVTLGNLRKVVASISFKKEDAAGNDLALWLHDNLAEHGQGAAGKRAASRQGRGPKFIEGPLLEIVAPNLQKHILEQLLALMKLYEKGR